MQRGLLRAFAYRLYSSSPALGKKAVMSLESCSESPERRTKNPWIDAVPAATDVSQAEDSMRYGTLQLHTNCRPADYWLHVSAARTRPIARSMDKFLNVSAKNSCWTRATCGFLLHFCTTGCVEPIAGVGRMLLIDFGSPTRARTWDLRINRSILLSSIFENQALATHAKFQEQPRPAEE